MHNCLNPVLAKGNEGYGEEGRIREGTPVLARGEERQGGEGGGGEGGYLCPGWGGKGREGSGRGTLVLALGTTPAPFPHGQTHACENITFPSYYVCGR